MAITIELSPAVEAKLRAEIVDLNRAAKLGLAVEAYRSGTLTLGQFAELVGVSQYEADGILKERGVMLDLDDDQLAEERGDIGSSLGIMIVVADASPLPPAAAVSTACRTTALRARAARELVWEFLRLLRPFRGQVIGILAAATIATLIGLLPPAGT